MINKKIIIILTYILFILTLNFPQDFQHFEWGDSMETIIKNMKIKSSYIGKNLVLYKNQNIAGLVCHVRYFFCNDGKLALLEYVIDNIEDKYTEKKDCINDYENLRDLLIKKYGKPDKIEDDSAINKEIDGITVTVVNTNKKTTWKTKDTEISLNIKFKYKRK